MCQDMPDRKTTLKGWRSLSHYKTLPKSISDIAIDSEVASLG